MTGYYLINARELVGQIEVEISTLFQSPSQKMECVWERNC